MERLRVGQQVRRVLSDRFLDERDRRVHHCDRPNEDGGNCLVSVGDRTNERRVVGIVVNVVSGHGDAGSLQTRTEPLTEHSTGSPVEVDRRDVTGFGPRRFDDLPAVQLHRKENGGECYVKHGEQYPSHGLILRQEFT